MPTDLGQGARLRYDGYTIRLLGGGRLVREPDVEGRVSIIFPSAEEDEGGGRVMTERCLLERFLMEVVHGLYHWPGVTLGEAAVHVTALMDVFDVFTLRLRGRVATRPCLFWAAIRFLGMANRMANIRKKRP